MAEFMSLLFGIADGVTNVSATTVIALIALFLVVIIYMFIGKISSQV